MTGILLSYSMTNMSYVCTIYQLSLLSNLSIFYFKKIKVKKLTTEKLGNSNSSLKQLKKLI